MKSRLIAVCVFAVGLGWLGGSVLGKGVQWLTAPPPSPTPEPYVRKVHITEGQARAAMMVDSLLQCRNAKKREVCSGPNAGVKDRLPDGTWAPLTQCEEARAAILGDGIFQRLGGLKDQPNEQMVVTGQALNACLGLGGSDLADLLHSDIARPAPAPTKGAAVARAGR